MKPAKIQSFFFILCFLVLANIPVFSQRFFENTSVLLGYSIQNQDRRMIEVAPWVQADILDQEDTETDREYHFTIQKRLLKKNKFGFHSGIGYTNWKSTFSRFFEKCYFQSPCSHEAAYIDTYSVNSIVLPNTLSYTAWSFSKRSISLFTVINGSCRITQRLPRNS